MHPISLQAKPGQRICRPNGLDPTRPLRRVSLEARRWPEPMGRLAPGPAACIHNPLDAACL